MNTPQDFCLWLQGFVELQNTDSVSDNQWLIIKDHLKLVFDKVTPDRSIEIKPSITFPNSFPKDFTWPKPDDHLYKVTC